MITMSPNPGQNIQFYPQKYGNISDSRRLTFEGRARMGGASLGGSRFLKYKLASDTKLQSFRINTSCHVIFISVVM